MVSVQSVDIADLRLHIECETCGKPNPPKRCSRCHLTFYCSVDCQRQHWRVEHKGDCRPIDGMRSQMDGFKNKEWLLPDSAATAAVVPVNTACAICLEDPIPSEPVVLPKCNHAFCFSCIQTWQSYSKFDPSIDYSEEPSDGNSNYKSKNQSCCPYCRQDVEKSAVQQAMETAALYAGRAKGSGSTVAERTNLYNLAIEEVDKVLDSNPIDFSALFLKAQILSEVSPLEAIQVLETMIETDKVSSVLQDNVEAMIEKVDAARMVGDEDTAELLLDELEEIFSGDGPKPRRIGNGPRRLFPVLLLLAETQEAAGLWDQASLQYRNMLTMDHETTREETDPRQERMIFSGASRCFYQLGQYERAMFAGQAALSMNRHFPGVHKLIAMPQKILKQQKEQGVTHSLMAMRSGAKVLQLPMIKTKKMILMQYEPCVVELFTRHRGTRTTFLPTSHIYKNFWTKRLQNLICIRSKMETNDYLYQQY